MKLTSMKRTPAELKAEKARYSNPIATDAPSYDYGLRIRLGKESLAKLGLKPSELNVGDTVTVTAQCEVCEISQNDTRTHKSGNVELQIEKMAVNTGAASAADAVRKGLEE
jgi:phage gp45-like